MSHMTASTVDTPRGTTGVRAAIAGFLAALLEEEFIFALTSASGAQAYEGVRELQPNGEGLVTQLENDDLQVEVEGERLTVSVDAEADTATVTRADGTQAVVPMGGFAADPQEVLSGNSEPVYTTNANVACTYLFWVIETIHTFGWSSAVAAVAATGPVGATVLVTMYALGSTGFLVWASSRC